MLTQTEARIQFMAWVQDSFPALAAAAIDYADTPTVAGLGAEESFWNKLGKGLVGLGSTYLALKNQREALKINLERAKMGQPPIDMASTAPVIRTQVEIDPALASKLATRIGGGINTTMLMMGAGLLALLFFMKK